MMAEVKRIFKPEFLNRIDETIVFHALTKIQMRDIVTILLDTVIKRVAAQMEIILTVTEEAKDLLVELGYDEKYGARPLKRTIQNQLEDELAEKILAGEVHAKDHILVDRKEKELNFCIKK